MTLIETLTPHFSRLIRNRGQDYVRRVRIVDATDTLVQAEVTGSGVYKTEISLQGLGLSLSCTCPFFRDDGPCKHLWATVIVANQRGYLARAINAVGDEVPDDRSEESPFVDEPPPLPAPEPQPRLADWERLLAEVTQKPELRRALDWPEGRQVMYAIDVSGSRLSSDLLVDLFTRDPRRSLGGWSKPKPWPITKGEIVAMPDPEERDLLAMLHGAEKRYGWSGAPNNPGSYSGAPSSQFSLSKLLAHRIVPTLARTGRLYLHRLMGSHEMYPVTWDDSGPWQLRLEVREDRMGGWMMGGVLHRSGERLLLTTPILVSATGFLFTKGQVAEFDTNTPFQWTGFLQRGSMIPIPAADGPRVISRLIEECGPEWLELPGGVAIQERPGVPRPGVRIRKWNSQLWGEPLLGADVWFDYEGTRVISGSPQRGAYRPHSNELIIRDMARERDALDFAETLGFQPLVGFTGENKPGWRLNPAKLPKAVRELVASGWQVEAEGKHLKAPGRVGVSVASGIDWFELRGEVEYEGTVATLPDILNALRRKDNMVRLGDGTFGLLPEEWLERFAPLLRMADEQDDHVRFRRNQIGLLDALLAAQVEVRTDSVFDKAREEILSFRGIETVDQPEGFVGTLRDYQRDGLAWMHFLRRFGWGGCLADDMGVGKTAQVLALLETRRTTKAGVSLVVVPRSLVFNWKLEAARFTPNLRVLDYTGAARKDSTFDGIDVVITTYGTLRRDIADFQAYEFDYIVLDEAQAVKNANTDGAKAVRLLKGRHRLALSGTPVENHLGELWSLFEFLNPGMLGSVSVFQLTGGLARNPNEDTRQLLSQALRPLILRRTKEQVARELPPKTEQTIHCEMEEAQRKVYNDLRVHYRQSLLSQVERVGMAKTKMHVLEALLRLRQAACHPGLLDDKRANDPSAKFTVLMEHLEDVLEGGHKALVFSQFTSLLALVKKQLDARSMVYEYLDGATRDRKERVERFQTDPNCPLFLLSLKAGGLGLNLTAADYVFLLDPWWNPAVEAQAVDRAHRIGQERHVFAYRLIARDTVEEKVLELQKTKRDLADAILSQDNPVLRNLKREDLELLLS